MKSLKTNEEFLGELMMFSNYGALIQVFIIEAIRHYCEQILATPKPTVSGDIVIDARAWYGCAEEIAQKMKDNYESNKRS